MLRLNSRSRCHLYIGTFAFSTTAYLGVTFPRTCMLVSAPWWCPCWASSGVQPWSTGTWHGQTLCQSWFSCAWFPGGEGMLKVLLCFHGQRSRALVCLVSCECKPQSFSKPDFSSTFHPWICSFLILLMPQALWRTQTGNNPGCMNHWIRLLL